MHKGGTRARHDWIDIAKAISIVLVVLGHELVYFGAHGWSRASASAGFWEGVGAFLIPVRMPLFFLASGLLASPSLALARPDAFRKRVFSPLYLYLLWATIFAVVIPTWPSIGLPGKSATALAVRVIEGFSPAWYLWALPVSFCIGWFTRKLPAWLPIGVACVLPFLPVDHTFSGSILRCLAYFLLGLRVPGLAAEVGSRASKGLFLASLALFVLLWILAPEASTLARPLVEFTGVVAAAIGCALLARASPAAVRAGRWLGPRTLPVYLFHFPLLTLLEFRAAPLLPAALLQDTVFVALFPLVATATVFALCLLAERLVLKARFTWLLQMPRRLPPQSPRRNAPEPAAGPADSLADGLAESLTGQAPSLPAPA